MLFRSTAELGRLYASARLFINYFQPSFKLAEKYRDGARVRKKYHSPATPYQRLLDDPRTPPEVARRIGTIYATLDPVRLLQDIRAQQQLLVDIAATPLRTANATKSPPTIEQFLASLKTAWQEGEPNPATRPKLKVVRGRRRPDPLAAVSPEIEAWFAAEPWRTSRELLDRLQAAYPRKYSDGHLRTLQRRLKQLRRQAAHNLVLGAAPEAAPSVSTLGLS